MNALAARVLDALPQTQCTRCGYPDCRGYADAIAAGAADINRCPPGGAEGIGRLAALTGRAALPLDPACGVEAPRTVAVVDENWCIGCTLCIDACPTDAIVGSAKRMHTVIEEACTGCELCLPVCPVDCIVLENASGARTGWDAWPQGMADTARARYQVRLERRARDEAEQTERQLIRGEAKLADLGSHSTIEDPELLARKRLVVAQALEQARARRTKPKPP